MRVKLVEHHLGNVLDLRTFFVITTGIMARPDETCRWFIGPERTLNTFEIAEQLFEVRDMMTGALIVILPTMHLRLGFQSQDKRINILLGKRLQRLGVRILLDEKGKKVSQTIGNSMKSSDGDTSRQSVFDILLDDRTKEVRDALKINVVIGGMWRVAQSRYQSG